MPLFRQTYTLEAAEPVIELLYTLGYKPGRQGKPGTPFFYAEPRTNYRGERIIRITASSDTEHYEALTAVFPSKVGA